MKIFNTENGVKKVYVQLNDLSYLMHYGDTIPVELMNSVFGDVFIVTDENRFEFMEFSSESIVKFFEGIDWIVDYKKYRNMSEQEIIDCGQEISKRMNEIAFRHNKTDPDNSKRRMKLADMHSMLDFKVHSLAEILWVKQGKKTMPFPIVPDSDGFTLQRDTNDCLYVVSQGINPLQHLLYRTDGEPFSTEKDKNIPQGLVNTADGLCISSNTETNEFFGNFKLKRELTPDKKYLVTTFNMISPVVSKVKNEDENKTLSKRLREKFSKWLKKKDD